MGKLRDIRASIDFKELKLSKFLWMTMAGIISAIGITTFLSPVHLYDSGIAGTSLLLSQLTPPYMSLSLFLIILNIPLLLYGYKKEGFAFTVYSIFAVLIYSLSAWIIEDVIAIDVSEASPIAGTDLLLCAIFGGLICGLGSGLAVRHGGAIDGIEVMAVIFAKKLSLTVGTFMMCYNVILYSIVTYYAALQTIDFVAEGIDRSKAVMIITDKADKVSMALIAEFGSGTTKLPARGGFTNKEKAIVYFVVNRFQISRMRDIVHKIDPKAYMTITEVADIYKYEPED